MRSSVARSFVWRSRTSSTPIIRPRPRTSPISRCLSASAFKPGHQMAADLRRIRDQLLLQQRDRRERRGARHGLPPNVLACAPGGHVIRSARADATPSGSPDAMPFAIATMSGSHAGVLDREHLPGAPHPRLHFVDDEQDAVLLRQLAQPLRGTDRGRRRSRLRPESARRRSPRLRRARRAARRAGSRCSRDTRPRRSRASGRPGSDSSRDTARGSTPA